MIADPSTSLADRLEDALPQTQCRRCGYPDCRGYAEAIAAGEASIDRCPPGGAEGIERLARIAGLEPRPLDPEVGLEASRTLAVIDEAWCIGCTLCLDACPVDCIVGASKQMHTVIEDLCTGCELCLPVCPVDCIALLPASGERTGWAAWSAEQAQTARERYAFHRARLANEAPVGARRKAEPEDDARARPDAGPADGAGSAAEAQRRKRETLQAILTRARGRRADA